MFFGETRFILSMDAMPEITLEFLQNLLQGHFPDAKIQDFQIAPGSKRGDNYTSMLYRITMKGIKRNREMEHNDSETSTEEPWEGSVIYKCLPESTLRREAFKSDALFCNELAFYTKILPALLNFQKGHPTSSPFKAIPKCYLAQKDLIILEDLNREGFAMPDRKVGLTIEQCYAVLKVLSQFHALSLAMKFQDPEEFHQLLNLQDGISEGFFISENEEWYRSYYRQATRNAIAMLEQELSGRAGGEGERYARKFSQFCAEERYFGRMVELVTPREPLAVISHGDCWTNNFLFRRVGDGAEVCLVDFQLVRYASPALDAAYVCYLCTTRQQREEHLSSLLEFYGDELYRRLTELTPEGRRTPTDQIPDRNALLDTLQGEFRRAGLFALGIAVDMFPIMTCDSDEAPNLYQAKENEVSISTLNTPVWTSNETCRKKLTDLVVELVDNGIL